MAKYLFAYHGGATPESTTQEERDAIMGQWRAWYEELGESIVDGGAPTALSKTVAADGTVSDTGDAYVTGYTIISADSLDDALVAAKGCPIRESNGSIEVAELIDMAP